MEAHTNGRETVECVLIGNKNDLLNHRVVAPEEGKELAAEFGMEFFETSARTGFNVQETLFHIAKRIKDKMQKKEPTNS